MTILLQAADFRERKNFGSFSPAAGFGEPRPRGGDPPGGNFAADFLQTWPGRLLYCVDHWLPHYDPDDGAAWVTARRTIKRRSACFPASATGRRSCGRPAARRRRPSGTARWISCTWMPAIGTRPCWTTWRPGGPRSAAEGFWRDMTSSAPGNREAAGASSSSRRSWSSADRQNVPMVYLVPDHGAEPWSFYVEKL